MKKNKVKGLVVNGRKLSLRGRALTGEIIRMSMQKTATIEFERDFYIKKYERYEKRKTRLHVHKPDDVDVAIGDMVEIRECRPISKTKNFVIVGKLKNESN